MNVAPSSRRIRLTPVILTAIFALALLKAAGLWLNFSTAGAAETGAATNIGKPVEAPAFVPAASQTSKHLLEQLAVRKEELDVREKELDTREKLLAVAEVKLEAGLKQLHQEGEALSVLRDQRDHSQQQDFEALSNAYERMKARDAARIFNVLDDDILVPVAAGMRTQALAGVLAEMTPEKAKALTKALAGLPQKSDPPSDQALQ